MAFWSKEREIAVLRRLFGGRREVGRIKSWTSSRWCLCVFVGNRDVKSGGTEWNSNGARWAARPLSGRLGGSGGGVLGLCMAVVV